MKYHLTITHLNIISVILLASILLTACQPSLVSTPEYISPTNSPIPTKVNTPTTSPTSTLTPTKVPTYTFHGKVFFDFNGNGNYDDGELPISGAIISIGDLNTTSAENGDYVLTGIEGGTRKVSVKSPNQKTAEAFRYVSFSLEMFQPIEKPINLTINSDTELDIALMQGFLTLPFACDSTYSIGSWYDLDNKTGLVRNWEGKTKLIYAPVANSGTLDQHDGIDYLAKKGVTIVSTAPGVVTFAGEAQNPVPGYKPALVVEITHIDGYVTHYGHVDKVLVQLGQTIYRGQPISEVGSTGSSMVHLHWSIRTTSNRFTNNPIIHPDKSNNFDPYRDNSNDKTITFWTIDNDPQCLP